MKKGMEENGQRTDPGTDGRQEQEDAVLRGQLQQALDSGERICVYGDYDCDGVTATALLYSFLEAMGGRFHLFRREKHDIIKYYI